MSLKNEKFVKYLNGLRLPAQNNDTQKAFREYEKYYMGKVAPVVGYSFGSDPKRGNYSNSYNCIRPIIETKATIALDAQISTSVEPSTLSHANWEFLKEIESVSEILNDVWENVKTANDLSTVNQQVVRDGLIYGLGVGKVSWDASADDGLGNVSITRINPTDFFPEPAATSVGNANYIFVRRRLSKFDLINQYQGDPRVMEIIDKLDKRGSETVKMGDDTNILQGYENSKDSGQAYLNRGGVIPTSSQTNFEIFECYLKDDTIFQPEKNDLSDTEQVKREQIFQFPNGRLIVYCGDYILEDRPIDYPFGFPFATFAPTSTNQLVGYGDVKDLMNIQQKLTDAYFKLSELINKYKSMLIVSPDSIDPNDLKKNFDIISSKRGSMQPPVLVQNKLTQDIQLVRSHIDDLKRDALALSRINEMMLSGERQIGVNSGQMVRDLNESPLSSIREIQRNFKTFLVNLSNKGITLIQLYYTQPRIMRLSGQRYAIMNQDSQMMDIVSEDPNVENQQLPQNLINDLTLTQYEVQVQTGSALPQSNSAIAATTMQLAKDGILGDINDIDTKEIILKALDYPHYRAIIDKLKADQEAQAQMPIEPEFTNYLKNVNMSLGDILDMVGTLSPQVQETSMYQITDALGLTQGNPELQDPMTPPLPPMGDEGIQLSFN